MIEGLIRALQLERRDEEEVEILLYTASKLASDLYFCKEIIIMGAVGGAIAAAALNRFSKEPFLSPRGTSMAAAGFLVSVISTRDLIGVVLGAGFRNDPFPPIFSLTILLGITVTVVNAVALRETFFPWCVQEKPAFRNDRILTFREKFLDAVKERMRTHTEKLSDGNPIKPLTKGFLVKDRLENARGQV